MAVVAACALAIATFLGGAPMATAQDFDQIVSELERTGYYIESGADATDSEMRSLVNQGNGTSDTWYFVVLSGPAEVGYAADLRDAVQPTGNVLLHSVETDAQGAFDQVDFATGSTESIEERALAAFDTNWARPVDYMDDVIADFAAATTGSSSAGDSGSSSTSGSSGSGGFPWGWFLGIPAVLGGGLWFMSRRGKKKKQDSDLDAAQKIRAALQSEIDELANDVLVLSGPVDLSDKPQAVEFYREATDTYLDISDELPDMEELQHADLGELSDFGARVALARWQMDAAEALMAGEPLPEKPKVEPPPPPPTPPQQRTPQQRQQQLPQRAPRARVPYSPSRRRSGGGLLDVLITGAGMAGATRGRSRGRSAGGLFGGGSSGRTQSRQTRSQPRAGGGVFGGSSRSRSTNRPTSSRSSSRRSSSSSRRSSGSRSTSKRRRR